MNDFRRLPRLSFPLTLLACSVMLAFPARAAEEPALRAALERLAGAWTGEAQVKAMDGFVLKTVTAERRVAWEQDALVVETILRDGSAQYAVVARHAIRLGRLESAVTRPSQPEDRYLGEVSAEALVWINAEGNRRDARESVSERGGELVLETTSVEPIRALGLSGLVRIDARYRRPAPPGEPASVGGASGADLAALQGRLEQERLALATWRVRAEEAERRLAALPSLQAAADSEKSELAEAQTRLAALESERSRWSDQLRAAEARVTQLTGAAERAAQAGRASEERLAVLEEQLARALESRGDAQARLTAAEATAAQVQQDNERLLEANAALVQVQRAHEERVQELEKRLAVAQTTPAPVVAPAPAGGDAVRETTLGPRSREDLLGELQRLERRVLELESDRNAAREQTAIAQRQLEETRRLRDETLARFQGVVTELNAMRDEKERLARANVSLQAEVRAAQQQQTRGASAPAADAARAAAGPVLAPATTLDGKTADMVIAGLQIIGVTRSEGEDKAILDGRLYRNGDLIEAQLGIVFVRIEDNALVFQDRRGREYRRRF